MEFSDAELTDFCRALVVSRYHWPMSDQRLMVLQKHHIDILLSSHNGFDVFTVFGLFSDLSPDQIEFGLNHPHVRVRDAAYKHKCCTDEQKVRYELTHGGENAF